MILSDYEEVILDVDKSTSGILDSGFVDFIARVPFFYFFLRTNANASILLPNINS